VPGTRTCLVAAVGEEVGDEGDGPHRGLAIRHIHAERVDDTVPRRSGRKGTARRWRPPRDRARIGRVAERGQCAGCVIAESSASGIMGREGGVQVMRGVACGSDGWFTIASCFGQLCGHCSILGYRHLWFGGPTAAVGASDR